MQAIFVVGFFVVKKGKCAGMAPPHRATLVLSASNCSAELVRGSSANRRAEKNRNRRIYWRPGFYVAGVEKFPPGSYGWSVTKIASLEIQPESQTRDDRSDDRFWLERKGKAVTGVHWLVRIDSREMPQRAFPQSRSNLHLGRVRKGVFCMATSIRDAEIRVDNLAHEPPPSPHDRRRKNLFLHKSGDTAATSPFSSTRSLNTT